MSSSSDFTSTTSKSRETCITNGCGSHGVCPLNLQLMSHANSDVLASVSIWIFCITPRAGALSNLDRGAINEQPGRGKSSLEAEESLEAVSRWRQDGGNGGSRHQGATNC